MEEAEGNTLSQKGRRRGKKPPEKTLFYPAPPRPSKGGKNESVAFTARQTRLVIPSHPDSHSHHPLPLPPFYIQPLLLLGVKSMHTTYLPILPKKNGGVRGQKKEAYCKGVGYSVGSHRTPVRNFDGPTHF